MSTPDFAAAQARVAARRAARAQAITQTQALESTPQLPSSFLNLPPGLRNLTQSGLDIWNTVRSPYGTRPAFRVGQVDAELLDEELLQLLRGQFGDALKYFGSHLSDDWGAEIVAGLRLVLWKLSIWDRGTSYGGSLQGLRYVDARRAEKTRHGVGQGNTADPTRWQRTAYGLLTVGGRYGWQKWEDWLLDREGGYELPSPLVQTLGKASRWFSTTHEVAALASFLVFLYNGRYRTLADRILRLRLVPTSAQTSREVSFEYLNRQLVWHAFTEFLLFLLPLVGIGRWRRILARAWGKVKSFVRRKDDDEVATLDQGELAFLPERTCAICYKDQNPTSGASEAEVLAASGGAGGIIGSAQTDVTNPYETIPCGCVYCFVCIAHRLEADEGEGWTCLRCGELVKECQPWSGDVEEVTGRSGSGSKNGSRKSVVFAEEEAPDEYNSDDDVRSVHEGRRMSSIEPMPIEDEGVLVNGVDHDSRDAEEMDEPEEPDVDELDADAEHGDEDHLDEDIVTYEDEEDGDMSDGHMEDV